MKKLLILLAVAALPSASGCCVGRLCPCCPCNWFNRPTTYCAPACPPTYAAPLAATCAPPCAPYSPCAPVATAAPYMPAMAQQFAPQCATCATQPVMTQAQPMYYQAPMPMNAGCNTCGACYAEPSCAYSGDGGPAMAGYGGDCGSCGSCGSCESCSSCGSGGCSSCNSGAPGGAITPTPTGAPDPGPGPGA
jgi:hypothetical protein